MSLTTEVAELAKWRKSLLAAGMAALGGAGAPMSVLDMIFMGALKRALTLGAGLLAMVEKQNMVCARALLRMHMDTVTRMSAYECVDNPEAVAMAVLGGTPLRQFKSTDGKHLKDHYLVDRLTAQEPWARNVYNYTSGYVHFSERQVFDAVAKLENDEERTVHFSISDTDDKYPEASWEEVVACFNRLNMLLKVQVERYADAKKG